ncbi:MAG: mannose-1-phosphate guanylyltransferase/mannose-6-phosphate isomerase [Proteobacteria bacterium]|nr:mannose-1-phosphate guanylyltransferase/mannose-6-phosphate isomerase [Pseudomonadota bacterium]
MVHITPVVLCGGSGTRLWPLSRKSFPKQFVPLIGDKSLLQLSLERVAKPGSRVIAVASEEHRFMVTDAMQAAHMAGEVILEPVARNTAAAMALAALRAEQTDQDLLLFCPSDQHVPDIAAFRQSIEQGIAAAESGAIVVFGVLPSFPSTAYGYIQQGADRSDGSHQVARFIEKPDAAKAQDLLLSGNVLWNAGIFLCKKSVLIKALAQHAPDILQACSDAIAQSKKEQSPTGHTFIRPNADSFASCRAQSIDYAVMEAHANVAVVPFRGQWSDVGSWNAVADLYAEDQEGNRIQGQGLAHQSRNVFIHAPHRPVVALGTEDLLIIDTPDAVLVASRGHAEQVKDVVAKLEKNRYAQAVTHRKVARPWGWYDSIDMGDRFQVKRIGVKPGASLSLQKHHHRAEHWVVVKGTAEVTRGSDTFLISENQSTYIPVGELHRLKNPGMVELEIIEIQSGSYLGEDDIVRIEDNYGRTK